MKVIRIIENSLGPDIEPQYNGKFIVDYEFTKGERFGKLTVHGDINKAKRFNSAEDAIAFWTQVAPDQPTRDDGKPNRPLTAFSVEILSWPFNIGDRVRSKISDKLFTVTNVSVGEGEQWLQLDKDVGWANADNYKKETNHGS